MPDWVLTHFRKIVFHFLWGSKIETVSCQTLSAPATKCSLGVADLNAKCVALQLPLADRWKSVGNIGFENFKNDLACIITLQEVKVRDSLCSWWYIDSPNCAYCDRRETTEHCFLHCKRVHRVWVHFLPTISALLGRPFVPSIQSVFFYMWQSTDDTSPRIFIWLRLFYTTSGFLETKLLFMMAKF